jgi:hypothetical protein
MICEKCEKEREVERIEKKEEYHKNGHVTF